VSRFPYRVLVLLSAFCLGGTSLLADGGTLQFRKQAGPFIVTVFTAPVPLRAGVADISVMVQDGQDNSPVLDANVSIQLSKTDEQTIDAKATTSQAKNKLLYASAVEFPNPGRWRLGVRVGRGGTGGEAAGEISVLPEEAPVIAYWLYFAMVPLGVTLFALNQWLKQKRRPAPPQSRPPFRTL
ncbi:MAG TPA: FixH family protein, partial [Bryobacteraceae bacterium]